MKIDIKKCVSDGAQVTFSYYRDKALWYKTIDGDIFPVPVADIDQGTFNVITLMRWMRKWNDHLEGEWIQQAGVK